MVKTLTWSIAAIICGLLPATAAPTSRGLLMVWDTSRQATLKPHIDLAELLKVRRDQGLLSSGKLANRIQVLDFAKPAQAATCKRLHLTRGTRPYLCITRLKGDMPQVIDWKITYATPDEAMTALEQHLAEATGTEPAPVFTPVP